MRIKRKVSEPESPKNEPSSGFNFISLQILIYSGARLIHMANARKNCVNYLSKCIIPAYFTLSNIMLWRVVYQTIMWIIRKVRISEGQIIQAIL